MTGAAIFDWDGTLVDSRAALLRAWHQATEAVIGRRYPATPDEETLVFTRPGRELFAVLGGDDGPDALAAAFQAAYEPASVLVQPFPGVREAICDLRADGIRIGVVTSKARVRYATDARRGGLEALVEHAVCVEDTTAHKPDAAPVTHALVQLGVPPSRAVVAGDTPVDIVAGLAAGAAAIGVAWGASTPDALADAGAAAIAYDTGQLAQLVVRQIRLEAPA